MNKNLMCLLVLLLSVLMLTLIAGCGKSDPADSKTTSELKKQKYHCPMHPTYISDRPGDCPICNMKLVPMKDLPQAATKTSPENPLDKIKPGQYYCPMHPEIIRDAPGICPKCNMDLEEKKQESASEKHSSSVNEPGRKAIVLSPEKRQMIGLQLSSVEKKELVLDIQSSARVEHDETRYAAISPRFNGWARTLKVNFTGAPVEKGQALLTVYSPELLSAEKEYLLTLQNYERLKDGSDKEESASAQRLWESSRKKLLLWQIAEPEIRELEERRKPSDEMLFRAPFSGHVLTKTAIEGKSFAAGDTLYEIADLSHLWLRASVFEYQMPLVAIGQEAVISFPYLGNQSFQAKVTFIYPHIDPLTRKAEIRLELDNPKDQLRPGMWANVEIKAKLGTKLAIPASAVIDTGTRYLAFVDVAGGRLEPRNLKIGAKTDEYYEVLDGVKEGEKVVTRALFLVDSESQLKAAISSMEESDVHKH